MAWLGAALLLVWLVYALRALILPIFVAVLFALTLEPQVDLLQKRGYPRGVAIGLIYFVFLASLSLFLILLLPQVSAQMSDLLLRVIPADLRQGGDPVALATRILNRFHVAEFLRPPILMQVRHLPERIAPLLAWVGGSLPVWAGSLIWVVLVPVITFFVLLDFHKIVGKVLLLAPAARREGALTVVTEVIAVFGNYVRGLAAITLLDSVLIFLVLWAAGVREFALTLSVLTGLLYAIPYLGALTSTLLIALVTLGTQGAGTAIIVTVVMILLHQVVFDNILAPRILGRAVNLHPLLALFALLAGGTLLGIGGTLLAVPVAAAVQVILVKLFPALGVSENAVAQTAAEVKTTLTREIDADKDIAAAEQK